MLGFASFYVMDWGGANSNQSDPCPDTTYDPDGVPADAHDHDAARTAGAITGVFVEKVEYEPGPVDPTRDLRRGPADAVPGHARPLNCR